MCIRDSDHTYYNNTKVGTIMGRITNDLFDVTEFAHHCPEEFFIEMCIRDRNRKTDNDFGSLSVFCYAEVSSASVMMNQNTDVYKRQLLQCSTE